MKWVAISGSWKYTNKEIEEKVRRCVRDIISRGDGIVSGGALAVDYFATDEALKLNPAADKIKIFLPTTLEVYAQHYRTRANEGVITNEQAEMLIDQLSNLKKRNKKALTEGQHKIVNLETYFERISKVVDASDELIAFQVNESKGVQDTVNKAKKKGVPVELFQYTIV